MDGDPSMSAVAEIARRRRSPTDRAFEREESGWTHVSVDGVYESRAILTEYKDGEWSYSEWKGLRYDAEKHRHLATGGDLWAIANIGIRIRHTTAYVCGKYGYSPRR